MDKGAAAAAQSLSPRSPVYVSMHAHAEMRQKQRQKASPLQRSRKVR